MNGVLLLVFLLVGVVKASYNVGVGKSDITGPVAEVGMMGYASLDQKAAGLLNRLSSRAFLIEDSKKQRVLLINCDLQAVFQVVHQQVVKQLKHKYNGLYTEQNVVLHAQHTHAGPGGTSAYLLYDFTVLGFIKENYQVIVDGILKAVDRAHQNLQPGSVHYYEGELKNCGVNRSPEAYANNPKEERTQYALNKDVTMKTLTFSNQAGKLIGVQSFFPVHATSLPSTNKLVSGDNKGFAEWYLEQKLPGVIAGVGVSNAGDVSPNMVNNGDGTFKGEGKDAIQSTEIIGKRQALKILELINNPSAGMKLTGDVMGKLSYVDFSNVIIKGTAGQPNGDNGERRTCPAVLGQNFAAGTEDGRGISLITEGSLKSNPLFRVLGMIIKNTPKWLQKCHTKKKVPLIATGIMSPVPWTPDVLPVQLLKIGKVAIASLPFEVTTMAGRRIRKEVLKQLNAVHVEKAIIAAVSNGYAQYLTTNEEYAMQHYEGGSTLFGPHQLAAVTQELSRVAQSILHPSDNFDSGKLPRQFDISKLLNLQTGVVLDDKPLWKSFGDVKQNSKRSYRNGEIVTVTFQGGHPKNALKKVHSFCNILSSDGRVLYTDAHWRVRFLWERESVSYSKCSCMWEIDGTFNKGSYKIQHIGYWKSGWTGKLHKYIGTSSKFDVL